MSPESKPGRFTLEDVARQAQEVTLKDGRHVPMLLINGDNQSIATALTELPSTHEARRELMRLAGHAVAQSGTATKLEQVFFICEAWMSVAKEDGTIDVPPSQDPNRLEVLIISSLEVASNQPGIVAFEMVRDSKGELTELKPVEVAEEKEGSVETPLLDAFVDGFRSGTRGRSN
jgi:hypothetical protein